MVGCLGFGILEAKIAIPRETRLASFSLAQASDPLRGVWFQGAVVSEQSGGPPPAACTLSLQS